MRYAIIVFVVSLGLLFGCDQQECFKRVSHMSIEREYCFTDEGMQAVAEMYGNFLAGKMGQSKCECECDCRQLMTDLDKCRHTVINLEGQMIDNQEPFENGRIPPNELTPEMDWKK